MSCPTVCARLAALTGQADTAIAADVLRVCVEDICSMSRHHEATYWWGALAGASMFALVILLVLIVVSVLMRSQQQAAAKNVEPLPVIENEVFLQDCTVKAKTLDDDDSKANAAEK